MGLCLLSIPEGFTFILALFNQCWRTEQIPELWQLGRIAAIYKKGKNCQLPASYRPISILQVLYKLYTTLILGRLSGGMQGRIWKFQYGFQTGFSVDDAIFGILRILEQAHNLVGLPVYLLLLDWSRAYDRVHIPQMLSALARLGVPQKYIRIIKSLYSNVKFFVEDRFSRSTTENQNAGLRQGDGLSCWLFIALLSVIMSDAEASWIARAEQEGLAHRKFFNDLFGRDHCIYADDTNLISTCLRMIRAMLHSIQIEAARYGLTLNLDKTFLILAGDALKLRIPSLKDVHGNLVKCVPFERTLGFDLGPLVIPHGVVRSRGNSLLTSMNQYKLVWQSDLELKKKIERYFSLVVSKAIWGLHLLAVLPADFRHLEYLHTRCLRRILGKKAAYISRLSNAAILRLARAETLASQIRRKQLKLLGHVLRKDLHDPDRLSCFQPDQLLQPRFPHGCRRRVGRPRLIWAETILPECQRIWNLSRIQICTLAQNRREWFLASERLCKQLQPPEMNV